MGGARQGRVKLLQPRLVPRALTGLLEESAEGEAPRWMAPAQRAAVSHDAAVRGVGRGLGCWGERRTASRGGGSGAAYCIRGGARAQYRAQQVKLATLGRGWGGRGLNLRLRIYPLRSHESVALDTRLAARRSPPKPARHRQSPLTARQSGATSPPEVRRERNTSNSIPLPRIHPPRALRPASRNLGQLAPDEGAVRRSHDHRLARDNKVGNRQRCAALQHRVLHRPPVRALVLHTRPGGHLAQPREW